MIRKDHAQARDEINLVRSRSGGTRILRGRGLSRADYFLRKRSSRTTSAPSAGFSGSSLSSDAGADRAEAAGLAGRLVEATPLAGISAAGSAASNCKPNCTDGSKKLLIE